LRVVRDAGVPGKNKAGCNKNGHAGGLKATSDGVALRHSLQFQGPGDGALGEGVSLDKHSHGWAGWGNGFQRDRYKRKGGENRPKPGGPPLCGVSSPNRGLGGPIYCRFHPTKNGPIPQRLTGQNGAGLVRSRTPKGPGTFSVHRKGLCSPEQSWRRGGGKPKIRAIFRQKCLGLIGFGHAFGDQKKNPGPGFSAPRPLGPPAPGVISLSCRRGTRGAKG